MNYLIKAQLEREDAHLLRIYSTADLIFSCSIYARPDPPLVGTFKWSSPHRYDVFHYVPQDDLIFIPEVGHRNARIEHVPGYSEIKSFLNDLEQFFRPPFSEVVDNMPLYSFYVDSAEENSIVLFPKCYCVELTWDVVDRMQEIAAKHNYYMF